MSVNADVTARQARCGACLSRGRRLAPLGAARASHLLFSLGEDVGSELDVCWECRALVDKTLLFGKRMRRANDMLIASNPCTVPPDQDSNSASTLGFSTKTGYDYTLYSDTDDTIDDDHCQFACEDLSQDSQNFLSVVTPYLNLKANEEKAIDPFGNITDTVGEENANVEGQKVETVDEIGIKEEPTHSCHENKLMDSDELTCQPKSLTEIDEESDMMKSESANIVKTISAEVEKHSKPSIETCDTIVLNEEHIQIKNEENEITSNKEKDEPRCPEDEVVIVNVTKNANTSRTTLIQSKCVTRRVNEPINAKIDFPLLTSLLQNQHKSLEKLQIDTTISANVPQTVTPNLCEIIETEQSMPPDTSFQKCPPVNGYLPCKMDHLDVWRVYIKEAEMLKGRTYDRLNVQFVQSKFKCETCIVGFFNKELLEEHNQKKHSREAGPHVCDICSARFKSAVKAARHREAHYHRYVCEVCGFARGQRAETNRHYRNEHLRGAKIKCKSCGEEFNSLSKLNRHTETSHTPLKQCPRCPKTFKWKAYLDRHMKTHEARRTYECDVCGVRTTTKHSLVCHMRQYHKSPPGRASCAECNEHFTSTSAYRLHLKTHTNRAIKHESKYICDYCDKRFVNKSYLQRHILCIHLKCKYRKIYFEGNACKGKVQQSLKPVKDNLCNVCGIVISSSTPLSKHMLVHTGERPHQCDVCGATFSQGSSLYNHKKLVHLKMKRTKNGWIMKT